MEEKNKNEVTKDKLEEVNGGMWRESDKDYASGEYPRFHVGQIVEIVRGDHFVNNLAKILEVSSRKYGYWNREYVYKIQKNKWGTIRYEWAERGNIIEDVYESQLTEYND